MTTAKQVACMAAIALSSTVVSASSVSCSAKKPEAPTLSASESWCPDGFEVGPQDTCFAVPEHTTKDTPILVYLHGMYTGHGSLDEWSLVHSAIGKGFAVVVPRGKRGLCAWKEELKDHFCWPQESEDPQAFKSVVAEWDRVLWQVDAIMEGGQHKRYVLGFSNGGAFAEYLAAHSMFPAHAYAIVNGGPLGVPSKPAKAVPMLLVSADGDTDESGPNGQGKAKMKELHDDLQKSGWNHAYCTRPGNHPLAAQDLDTSLRFFKHDADGALKANAAGYYGCDGATNAVPEAAAAPAPVPADTPPPTTTARSKKSRP